MEVGFGSVMAVVFLLFLFFMIDMKDKRDSRSKRHNEFKSPRDDWHDSEHMRISIEKRRAKNKNVRPRHDGRYIYHGGCLPCITDQSMCTGCKYFNGVVSGYPVLSLIDDEMTRETKDVTPQQKLLN